MSADYKVPRPGRAASNEPEGPEAYRSRPLLWLRPIPTTQTWLSSQRYRTLARPQNRLPGRGRCLDRLRKQAISGRREGIHARRGFGLGVWRQEMGTAPTDTLPRRVITDRLPPTGLRLPDTPRDSHGPAWKRPTVRSGQKRSGSRQADNAPRSAEFTIRWAWVPYYAEFLRQPHGYGIWV